MFDRLLSELRHRWRALVHRRDVEAELDAELRFHLEEEAAKLGTRGLTPETARRVAGAAFGATEAIKDDVRDVRGTIWLEQTWADLRHAARGMVAHRAFAIGVVATLALGIGVNVTVFGIVDRLLFRMPLGLQHADRVHRVHFSWTRDGQRRSERHAQFPRFLDLARDTRSFEHVAAFQVRRAALGERDDTRQDVVAVVSSGLLDFFEAPPALGRWFSPAEDVPPTGTPVAVLGHAYWLSQYGGRADVLGTPLRIDRMTATIIGVAPPGFTGLSDDRPPAVFVPMSAFAHAARPTGYVTSYHWSWLELLVRRRPQVSIAAANADLTEAYRRSWTAENAADGQADDLAASAPVASLGPVLLGRGPDAGLEDRVALWMAGVALVVFLVACANVANLFLARAIARQREVAMRLALGVSRGRLIRQIGIESLLLGLAGGSSGVLLSSVAGGVLRTLALPADTPVRVAGDLRTLLFSVGLAMVAGLLTALAPALTSTGFDVARALKSGGRGTTRPRARLQSALVVVQAALSVGLLTGAAAFVLSLRQAEAHRLGLDVDRIVLAEVNLRGTSVDDAAMVALADRLEAAARSVPGVITSTAVASVPFWSNEGRRLRVPGIDDVHQRGRFTLQAGSTDYFATTGTRILRGRGFERADGPDGAPIVVVSDGMARAIWPDRDPLGRCLIVSTGAPGREDPDPPCRTVVGVAEETAMSALEPERQFTYYLPLAQYSMEPSGQFFFRVDGSPAALAPMLRARLQPRLPGVAYVEVRPLATVVAPQYRAWRSGATVFAVFGVLALVLAALGLHSLIAYDVAQRAQEFGVRVALGGSPSHVLGLVLGRGTRLVLVGVAAGVALALAVSGPLDALLFHQSARDPRVFGVVAVTLLATAVVACLIPGLRATRADPTAALRAE